MISRRNFLIIPFFISFNKEFIKVNGIQKPFKIEFINFETGTLVVNKVLDDVRIGDNLEYYYKGFRAKQNISMRGKIKKIEVRKYNVKIILDIKGCDR